MDKKNILICPVCEKFPNLQILLDTNDKNIIKYKCHENKYNDIKTKTFITKFTKEEKCNICKNDFSLLCFDCNKYFCKDDFLYHMIIDKHKKQNNIDCNHKIHKFIFCSNCRMKLCENCEKNEIHGPHHILSEKQLIVIYKTISDFIKNFRELKVIGNNSNNEIFINSLSIIYNIIKKYIKKDILINECLILLESLHLSIIKYLYETECTGFR